MHLPFYDAKSASQTNCKQSLTPAPQQAERPSENRFSDGLLHRKGSV
ncbi:M48 family peptidase [Neisseria bacilliformis ATCC BAA-1200]|uniref:M48 family peptidase n=1 Tax=Neisseria bacilliformis ATCC BAA-1200 TaxID=888742 RepID=F2BF57_9NEIS|nr:M48 family peptidase [Neisseria bacilliformis ATCC BAA-1200]